MVADCAIFGAWDYLKRNKWKISFWSIRKVNFWRNYWTLKRKRKQLNYEGGCCIKISIVVIQKKIQVSVQRKVANI